MKNPSKLQLTYIPARYWNDPISGFGDQAKKIKIAKDSSFFLLWQETESEAELTKSIKLNFSEIPSEKLKTCKLNLAISNGAGEDNELLSINKVLGKMLPITPAINLLFNLEIIK